MRFEFTVTAPAGQRDVAISAPDDTAPEALRRAVVDAAGMCGLALPLDRAQLPRTGALVPAPPGSVDGPRAAGASVVVTAGRCSGTVRPLRPGRFVVGRAPDCDLALDDASVSRRHVELDVGRRAVRVRDLASTNGSRIDGDGLEKVVELRPGQQLQLGNTAVELWAGADEPRAALFERGDTTVVDRSARPLPPSADVSIDLPDIPQAPMRQRVAWAGALAPAALGVTIAWLTGSLQFLLFAALTPVMLVSTSLGERVQWRRSRRRTATDRRRAMQVAQADVAAALTAERDRLRTAAPHPAAIELIAVTPTRRLWERGADDPDFLVLRLGIGTVASRCTTRCGGVETPAGKIAGAPVCVDLRAGPLGVYGPPDVVRSVGRWLLIQAASLHSPSLLRMALVLPGSDAAWHWARWLPHLTLPPADPGEVTARDGSTSPPSPPMRTLVLVDGTGVTRLPGVGDMSHAICLVSDRKTLPARCAHVLTVQDPRTSRAELTRESKNDHLDIVLDQVDETWAERVGRSLAPLSDGSTPGARAGASPSLCELFGTGAPDPALICAHWQRSGAAPRTVVGVGDDGPVWIDLARDGPHCLIAGTTGAGKSELLRTMVAGLALACSPTSVTFVLIDYKGGAAFAACADLPHVAGVVTDLDAHLTARALRALHAELRRRERQLAAAGVADIDVLHRTRPDIALPRLVVVVDEFATLADELPGFVDGLVGVARRGRSLGLHLVLATQRPGRAVTPDIKANTSLRIALRVTDAAESTDVIDSPLAATISPATPGAGFLRTGERLTAFRVARAASAPARGAHIEMLGRWRQAIGVPGRADADDGLRHIVSAVAEAARRNGTSRAARPWLPPLPAWIDDPGAIRGSSRIGLGLVDRPDEQRQNVFDIDLAEARAVVVCGTAGSGRTTMLSGTALRAARQISPERLEIYVIERADELRSMLGPLPHLASAVDAADPDLVRTLLGRLSNAVGPVPERDGPSHRLLLVDDWDAILAGAGDAAAASLTDAFATLLRTAAERALTVLVTGDRSLLAARWSFCAGMRLVLRLADRADYALAGIAARDVPTTMPPGRGLRADDGAEMQLFAPVLPPDATVPDAVAIGRSWSGSNISRTAIRIHRLPDCVDLGRCPAPPAGVRIGVGGDAAATIAVDLPTSGHLLVAGPPRSGRSIALLTVLAECLRTRVNVVVAAPHRSPVRQRAERLGVRVIGPETAADAIDRTPIGPAVVLVDDCEAFDDTAAGERLTHWLRGAEPLLGAVVAGRTDELASSYRGVGAEARRNRSGLLLRPGPVDGELFGVRLARTGSTAGPGRGVVVGVRCWAASDDVAPEWMPLDTREPVPIQVALGGSAAAAPDQPPAMCGYR